MATRLQLMPMVSNFAKHAAKTVGARHVEDAICSSTQLAPDEDELGQAITARADTTGCGGETMFELPIDDTDSDFARAEPAVVCAVDDMAYMFPKYGGDDFTS